MSKSTTVFANLLSHPDRSEFQNAVNAHGGDHRIRTLSTFDLFRTLTFGQVTSAYSLREIESSLAVNASKLYHSGMTQVKRSTVCDALEKRDHRIFESVFQSLVSKAQCVAGRSGRKYKHPLKIIDASTIELCIDRFDWAKFRTTKGAVKIHLKIDGDHLFPEQVELTTGAVHEINEMAHLCGNPGDIYVMDRGYVDYKRLYDIEIIKAFFVTRMKDNCQHEVIKTLSQSCSDAIRLDAVIKLTSNKGRENYPAELRKVCFHDDEYDRDYVFITNNFELSAQNIADIYKSRRQVELFFKWIKQNLKIKTFWGTSKNAVFIQIWIALIVSILLWLHKTVDGIPASTQRLIQMLKTTLFERKTIIDLFQQSDPPEKLKSTQLHFAGIKC
jgi:putative transposase